MLNTCKGIRGPSYQQLIFGVLPDCQEEQQAQPDDEQRWWYSIFARSGRLGSSAPQPAPASSSKPKVSIRAILRDLTSHDELSWRRADMLSSATFQTVDGLWAEQHRRPGSAWFTGSARDSQLCAWSRWGGPPLSSMGVAQVKVTGFSEDDQTNLYMMAHDASGKGRQGLGIASRPKKVLPLVKIRILQSRAKHVLQSQSCLRCPPGLEERIVLQRSMWSSR